MKTPFFLFPIFLTACSEQAMTHPPLVKVRPLPEAETAVKSSVPMSLTVDFDSLGDQVSKYNPSLASARQLIAEAQGQLRASGIRSRPELEVEFAADPRFRDVMLTVGVSQKFPRTNRLLIEKRVSEILVDAARAEVKNVGRIFTGEARQAFVEILAIREQRKLLSDQEATARKLAEFIKASANRGEASLLEVGTATLEATRFANQGAQIEIKEKFALANLKPLLGMPPEGELILKGPLENPEMPPMNVTSYHRPDLTAARLRAQSALTETDLERSKMIDDYEAGIFAGIGQAEDAPEGIEAEQVLGIRFKFPLGKNYAQQGVIDAARAKSNRLTLGAEALKRRINGESHAAYAEMNQWMKLAGQIESELFPLAEEQITKTKEAYSNGEIPLQDVLRAVEQKLALSIAHLEARRDFHLARVKYLTSTAQ
ncbi:TolC family protein [Akkermansiaceae bacterium]|nr:TolC family protein [Akkermansiaceae bacterium]MDB4537079.1 TolC family protein [Akkermansiaceae bacterium]